MESQDIEKEAAEPVYKIKVVQFFGRTVPIILQNDNGPCPLLAICNVLLLRNNATLSSDMTEIASSKLLSLVAERLLDSNSNTENKDEEYVCNQQQNIADAISLLHRLATGLDVNVRFRHIHDFEFTPECAVFDLLDIGLVHGWLCDPQDEVTSKVIGANSYNTLVEKVVELQSRKEQAPDTSADLVDFAAATAASLGVPSPSRAILLKASSFEKEEVPAPATYKPRRGDAEEAARLLEALKFSEEELVSRNIQDSEGDLGKGTVDDKPVFMEPATSNKDDVNMASSLDNGSSSFNAFDGKDSNDDIQSASSNDSAEVKDLCESLVQISQDVEHSPVPDESVMAGSAQLDQNTIDQAKEPQKMFDNHVLDLQEVVPSKIQEDSCTPDMPDLPVFDDDGPTARVMKEETLLPPERNQINNEKMIETSQVEQCSENVDNKVVQARPVTDNGSVDSSMETITYLGTAEPLYEGEAEVGNTVFENREPLYEGESILAECRKRTENEAATASASQTLAERSKQKEDEDLSVAVTEGMIIENFLKSTASQFTYYGLFCLQDGLKERELCVFFRNNHFSTMFKYNGNLYLLVTDQGYLNQPDIVWEKLNEVHGDTVFVTGAFTPFSADQSSGVWNEEDAIAATAGYLSSHQVSQGGAQASNVHNMDLELAMSLQHQEFEQQQQTRPAPTPSPRKQAQSGGVVGRPDGSRLVTGPKKSHYSSKPDPKSKCVVM